MDRYEEQLRREELQVTDGVERYHVRQDQKDVVDTEPGKRFMRDSLARVCNNIDNWRALETERTRGARPLWFKLTSEVDTEALAWIALAGALTAAVAEKNHQTAATHVGNAVRDHIHFNRFAKEANQEAKWAADEAETHAHEFVRSRRLRAAAVKAGVMDPPWTDDDIQKVGFALLSIVEQATGFIEKRTFRKGSKTSTCYKLTDLAELHYEEIHAVCAELKPERRAMIVPPRPWTSLEDGGYLHYHTSREMVRRPTDYARLQLREPAQGVLDALNAAQATPWTINEPVLRVMQILVDEDDEIVPSIARASITPMDKDLADKFEAKTLTDEESDRFMALCKLRKDEYEHRTQVSSKAMAFGRALHEAEDLRDEEEFYFPHSLDTRGRLYPLPTVLTPQGTDQEKALLQFKRGKPLGEAGGYWLHVHIANCFGIDKVSFDDRVQWTVDNKDKLLESAANPLDADAMWRQADDPWLALAAIYELDNLYLYGPDYVSRLPITMDGTSNGLQHLSAILRDTEGAEAVCLKPTDKPFDIYSEVSRICQRMMDNDESAEAAAAKSEWSGKVTRKIVKRPVMTTPYSVTRHGMVDQVAEEVTHYPSEPAYARQRTDAARLLVPVIRDAIREVVKRSLDAMEYLQEVTRLLVKAKADVCWLTPLGFPVVQEYWQTQSGNMKVWFAGRQRTIKPVRNNYDKPDLKGHVNGVAANYTHSMDATHLMMTVNLLTSEGFEDIMLIHDSVGVHACDVDELQYALRSEFEYLYGDDQDWLADFEAQAIAQADEATATKIRNLSPLREQGDFDIAQVRESDYFFS